MSGSLVALWIVGTVYGANINGFAQTQFTRLDAAHQERGNMGSLFRPIDILGNDSLFTLSSRSQLNQNDPDNPNAIGVDGTVFMDRAGAGVQGPVGNFGSKGISGKGSLGNEELIFRFDSPVQVSEIELGLSQIRFQSPGGGDLLFRDPGSEEDDEGEDDGDGGQESGRFDRPVLFFSAVGSDSFEYTLLSSQIESAFTLTGRDTGVIDFSAFDTLPADLAIDSFKIRATNDHFLVNSILNPVPEPSVIVLLAGGGLAMFLLKRRR